MKKLILTTSFILGLSSSVLGAEIKMTCDLYDVGTSRLLFKYQDKLFSDKAYVRHEGKWMNACDAIDKSVGQIKYAKREISVKDKALVCLYYYSKNTFNNLETTKWIIDFEAKTWAHYTNESAEPDLGGKNRGECN